MQIKVPVLILVGKEDKITPPEAAQVNASKNKRFFPENHRAGRSFEQLREFLSSSMTNLERL